MILAFQPILNLFPVYHHTKFENISNIIKLFLYAKAKTDPLFDKMHLSVFGLCGYHFILKMFSRLLSMMLKYVLVMLEKSRLTDSLFFQLHITFKHLIFKFWYDFIFTPTQNDGGIIFSLQFVCLCVCACVRARMCVCVCVYLSVSEKNYGRTDALI